MSFTVRFRQGMKAAIPIWIAFAPSSIAWGIAAQRHGLSFEEIILMSAWVYSGAIRRARTPRGEQIFVASSGRRFFDELALPADEHGAGAVFSRRETVALALGISRGQREQLHRALFAVSKRTRWDDARAVGRAAGWL